MSILVEKYGLQRNPFLPQELDPLTRPEDFKLMLSVDGFAELSRILETIEDPNAGAFFFLIAGRNGAGRTSAARKVLDAYRQIRDLDPKCLIVPEVEIRNEDQVETLQRWSAFLVNAITMSPVAVPESLTKTVMDAAANPARNLFEAVLQGALVPLGVTMQKVPGGAAFGVHLEDIRNTELVDSIFEIFAPVNTVIVMTITDYGARQESIIDYFKEKISAKRGALVRLTPLQGAEAKSVILSRWESVSAKPAPFTEAGLEACFGERPRPIGRVLALINEALTARASFAEKLEGWPDNKELGLDDEQLCGYIREFG